MDEEQEQCLWIVHCVDSEEGGIVQASPRSGYQKRLQNIDEHKVSWIIIICDDDKSRSLPLCDHHHKHSYAPLLTEVSRSDR